MQDDLGEKDEAIQTAGRLVQLHGSGEEYDNLDDLNRSLELYEQAADRVQKENSEAVDRSLAAFRELSKAADEIETGEEREEDSLLFEEIPGLDSEEVPILTIGGIDPIIAILEDEETIHLDEQEEDMDWPLDDPEPEEIIEKEKETEVQQKEGGGESPPPEAPPRPEAPPSPPLPQEPPPYYPPPEDWNRRPRPPRRGETPSRAGGREGASSGRASR